MPLNGIGLSWIWSAMNPGSRGPVRLGRDPYVTVRVQEGDDHVRAPEDHVQCPLLVGVVERTVRDEVFVE